MKKAVNNTIDICFVIWLAAIVVATFGIVLAFNAFYEFKCTNYCAENNFVYVKVWNIHTGRLGWYPDGCICNNNNKQLNLRYNFYVKENLLDTIVGPVITGIVLLIMALLISFLLSKIFEKYDKVRIKQY